jgi:hypothetical protein
MPAKLKLTSLPQKPAAFVEPMDCLAVTKLPESANWIWEVKIDGYRAIAVKSDTVNLFSRTQKSFNTKFPYLRDALVGLPAGTVIDGEVVAIDETGRPNFNLLQSFRTGASQIQYYVFDLLCLRNRDTTKLPLIERRKLLKTLSFKDKRIKIVDFVEAEPAELLRAVREQKLEGIIGKRRDSLYEPGKRTGAWIKHHVNRVQEFVVGGYFPGPHGFDSLIVGYYDADSRMSEYSHETSAKIVIYERGLGVAMRTWRCGELRRFGKCHTISLLARPIATSYTHRFHRRASTVHLRRAAQPSTSLVFRASVDNQRVEFDSRSREVKRDDFNLSTVPTGGSTGKVSNSDSTGSRPNCSSESLVSDLSCRRSKQVQLTNTVGRFMR